MNLDCDLRQNVDLDIVTLILRWTCNAGCERMARTLLQGKREEGLPDPKDGVTGVTR